MSVVIVSELGDKTWFIAAIMAVRHSRLTVFCGAMAALILMTLLSGNFSCFFILGREYVKSKPMHFRKFSCNSCTTPYTFIGR